MRHHYKDAALHRQGVEALLDLAPPTSSLLFRFACSRFDAGRPDVATLRALDRVCPIS